MDISRLISIRHRMMSISEPPDYPTITYTFTQASDGTATLYYPSNPAGILTRKVDGQLVTGRTVSVLAGEHTVELVMPNGVLPTNMFYRMAIQTAVITGPWKTFAECPFRECSSLTSCTLYLPTVTAFSARYTFYGCSNLTGEIELPELTTLSGYGHFQGCKKITKVLDLGHITGIADSMFYGCTSLTDVTLPSGITGFWSTQNFYQCSNLVHCTLDLPNLTSIGGRYTFADCSKLVGEVNFPSLTTISGYGHFRNTKITKVLSLGSITAIMGTMFYSCTALTDVTIPSTVTTIQAEAFRYCSSLVNISLYMPNVTTIGDRAFGNCLLTDGEVNMPALTSLGYNNFGGTSIKKVLNLGSITTIGSQTFYKCTKLVEATVPATVTSIGQEAFRDCSVLSILKVLATTPPTYNTRAVHNVPSTLKIYVPYGCGATYQAASGWSTHASKINELDENGNIPT